MHANQIFHFAQDLCLFAGHEGKPNHQRSNGEGKPERNFNKSVENREERNNRRNREDRPFNGNFENK